MICPKKRGCRNGACVLRTLATLARSCKLTRRYLGTEEARRHTRTFGRGGRTSSWISRAISAGCSGQGEIPTLESQRMTGNVTPGGLTGQATAEYPRSVELCATARACSSAPDRDRKRCCGGGGGREAEREPAAATSVRCATAICVRDRCRRQCGSNRRNHAISCARRRNASAPADHTLEAISICSRAACQANAAASSPCPVRGVVSRA